PRVCAAHTCLVALSQRPTDRYGGGSTRGAPGADPPDRQPAQGHRRRRDPVHEPGARPARGRGAQRRRPRAVTSSERPEMTTVMNDGSTEPTPFVRALVLAAALPVVPKFHEQGDVVQD